MSKILKRCWFGLAIVIITAAVVSSIFRALTPWAKQYKSEVERHLTTLIGQPVSIQSMETGWYWFEPVIKLKQVSVANGGQDIIQLKKLLVGINLLGSLWHWQIQPGVLYIDDLKLTLRQHDQQWQIDGLSVASNPAVKLGNSAYTALLGWLLAQQKIIIKNFTTEIHLQDGTIIPLRKLNLKIANHGGNYRIKGKAYFAQPDETRVVVQAQMAIKSGSPVQLAGEIFFEATHVQLAQWQKFLPASDFKVDGGTADIQAWFDVTANKIKNFQSRVSASEIAWYDKKTQVTHDLEWLKANLAWQPDADGWKLSGDRISMKADGIEWPENQFMVSYKKANDTLSLYAKHLLIRSLVNLVSRWPDTVKPVLASSPRGELIDTRLDLVNGSPEYLLTHFSGLSWRQQDTIPAVKNLSGVLNWQPAEGQVEFDSEQLVIKPKWLPAVTLKTLNGALEWKELSRGTRVTMERMVIEHPDLVLSATGAIDDVTADSAGQINLSAQLSAKHAQHWLQYLPGEYLKKKLEDWLKNDIKEIESLVAEVAINGQAADFPFDKQPGEFWIKGYTQGVDLVFAPHWPLATDLEAYLQFDKRNLDVNVVHGNLQGNIINNANLRIDDVGLDRETLLIHSRSQLDSARALAYVFTTPLKQKLSTLKMLELTGPVNLDLQLEVPLYPENDDVLALGDVEFDNNAILVKQSLNDVQLKAVNGSLQFDQEGVLDSTLKAEIMDYPVSLLIKSFRKPSPYTRVQIKAKTTIDVLRDKLKLAVFSLMEGELALDSLLILTDNRTDLDHLQIKTTLQGVAINLPEPLGKKAQDKTPLTIDVDFNPEKAVHLRSDYDRRISSDLWFSGSKSDFSLQKGIIRLGNVSASGSVQQGVRVIGVVPVFDWEQWRSALAKLPPVTNNNSLSTHLDSIDISIKKALIAGQEFDNAALRAAKIKSGEWSVEVNQEKIAGKLNYRLEDNQLGGQLRRLYWQKAPDNPNNKQLSDLKVKDMPNLDLIISDFKYNTMDLGELAIKATVVNDSWKLDSCQMTTPDYSLSAIGSWTQNDTINQTEINANLKVMNLAGILHRLQISPAVEAKKGLISFEGKWPGAYQDFSLSDVSGQLAITLKNGRITNLSAETEEKLGLGKLLSILSLQTIPRRLKLDFSDLSNDGYSFDIFTGSFKIKKGLMTTTDSYIDGPIAYASMAGDLDIARQLYNLDLRISPHITASLPVVATIAGGPIAGIATWVASKIISKGMQKISGYTYKVSGPWKQPVVQQVSIIKKKKV
ncbi:YhdP family protein [Legionella dresdenensis]|uniref:YhdP family protein n=1 Tax=Legionella dresdenensis TaxID=450200 RepID=A0ABV8CC75_9GAMM